MSDWFTAFIFAAGFGAWVYMHMLRSTNNQQTSLTGAIAASVAVFIVIITLLKLVLHF